MKTELINPKDYGLEESKSNELTQGLNIPLEERKPLIEEFNTISKLEVTEENIPKFKELRLKIVKNRTLGINKWHKTAKDFFLKGGQFVDAIKRKEILINEQMEDKLMSAEKHFEDLENKRLNELQEKRVLELSEYVEDAEDRDLKNMDMDVWNAFLSAKKRDYDERIKAENKAKEERIEKEKEEKLEQERIKKENIQLKKEAEEKEKREKIQRKKREKLETERKAKEDSERKEAEEKLKLERKNHELELKKQREEKEKIQAEEKAKREKLERELKAKQDAEKQILLDAENQKELELQKGDDDKFLDYIKDLENLKIKYSFKSKKHIDKYNKSKELLDKIINFIN